MCLLCITEAEFIVEVLPRVYLYQAKNDKDSNFEKDDYGLVFQNEPFIVFNNLILDKENDDFLEAVHEFSQVLCRPNDIIKLADISKKEGWDPEDSNLTYWLFHKIIDAVNSIPK
jgi:hypothetical protein